MQKIKEAKKKSPAVIFAIIFLSLAAVIVSWMLVVPLMTGNLRIGSRLATQTEVSRLLGIFSPAGETVYTELRDNACDDGTSVGLSRHIQCNFSASKFIKNKGDLGGDITQAETLLTDAGFRRTGSGVTNNLVTSPDQNIRGSFTYQKDEPIKITIELSYSAAPAEIAQIKQQYPKGAYSEWWRDFDYIYGLRITAEYYACSTVLMEPCLFVPGVVK